MNSARLYIGGIGSDVDQHMLSSKLASFGSVTNAEVKEKTDAEGSVTQRFAYVNIETTQHQLEQCFRSLNGSTWQGSNLRVELAKESFLDRLKRERAEATGQRQVTRKSIPSDSIQEAEKRPKPHTKEYEVIPNEKRKRKIGSSEAGVIPQAKEYGSEGLTLYQGKKKNKEEEKMMESFKTFSHFWADTDEDDDDNDDDEKYQGKKKNKDEEKVMASVKTFSAVWADTDEDDDDDEEDDDEEDDDDVVFKMSNKKKRMLDESLNQRNENFSDDKSEGEEEEAPSRFQDKRQNWGLPSKPQSFDDLESNEEFKTITKYNPTLQEHQQFRFLPPEAQKEKNGGQVEDQKMEDGKVQSTFSSLLSLFKNVQIKKQPITEATTKEPNGEVPAQLPLMKSHSFFLSSNDHRIEYGVGWMLENIEDKILPEFKAIENDLYDVIKTRSVRANKDLEKKLAQSDKDYRRKKMKKNCLKKASVAVMEEQNYDHGWRLAEIIHDEKKTGSGSKSQLNNSSNRTDQNGETYSEGSTQKNWGLGPRGGSSNPDSWSRGAHHQGQGRGRGGFGRGRGSGNGRGNRRKGNLNQGYSG